MHVYDTPGTFTVNLWVMTSDSCSASFSQGLVVGASPIADFSHQGGCADSPVQFTDLSTVVGGAAHYLMAVGLW